MKASMRARRMERSHRRMNKQSKLNLVSLMDIFTILVFFLMVNSGDVEVLQPDKTIKLPESTADVKPDMGLLLKVNGSELILQGQSVANVESVFASTDEIIGELSKALKHQASLDPELTEQQQERGRAITIMGDQEIPYALLKRVMATCAEADYRDIALAVSKLPVADPSSESDQELKQAMLPETDQTVRG